MGFFGFAGLLYVLCYCAVSYCFDLWRYDTEKYCFMVLDYCMLLLNGVLILNVVIAHLI